MSDLRDLLKNIWHKLFSEKSSKLKDSVSSTEFFPKIGQTEKQAPPRLSYCTAIQPTAKAGDYASDMQYSLRQQVTDSNPDLRTNIANESLAKASSPDAFTPTASVTTQELDKLKLPRFVALTRVSEFKKPDFWVARGKFSQLSSHASGLRHDIFIGLDFGTAFTKAAVQILDNIYPVDWSGVANLNETFLLPTGYSETASKECFLGRHPQASASDLHDNLKSAFITQKVTDDALAKACVFIALVLQYIRAWVYKHHGLKLGTSSIGWYLNIGIPSDVLDKDKHAKYYQKLADIAWELSLLPQTEITYKKSLDFQVLSIQHQADLFNVSPVPELVAQLAGYTQSSRRQNGLHTLVDIGGGTVDMVTFNVHQANGDDVFPFFVSRVKPFGSYAMLAHRFSCISNIPKQISSIFLDLHDALNSITFAKLSGTTVDYINDIDKHFFHQFEQEFKSVLLLTRQKRNPLSTRWREGVRTFVTGGGASIPGYADSVSSGYRSLQHPLIDIVLPPHPKLAAFDQDPSKYNRISVACGLAVDELSLGAIRPESEVDDFRLPLASTLQRLDRDDLYPK